PGVASDPDSSGVDWLERMNGAALNRNCRRWTSRVWDPSWDRMDDMAPGSHANRIAERLQALWQIELGPGGGAGRPAVSRAEADAMLLVAGWARDAGLEPAIDAHGNLWALPAGWDGPLVSAGSHVDTVPDGGRYDGALGTVLGLELAHDLREGTD